MTPEPVVPSVATGRPLRIPQSGKVEPTPEEAPLVKPQPEKSKQARARKQRESVDRIDEELEELQQQVHGLEQHKLEYMMEAADLQDLKSSMSVSQLDAAESQRDKNPIVQRARQALREQSRELSQEAAEERTARKLAEKELAEAKTMLSKERKRVLELEQALKAAQSVDIEEGSQECVAETQRMRAQLKVMSGARAELREALDKEKARNASLLELVDASEVACQEVQLEQRRLEQVLAECKAENLELKKKARAVHGMEQALAEAQAKEDEYLTQNEMLQQQLERAKKTGERQAAQLEQRSSQRTSRVRFE